MTAWANRATACLRRVVNIDAPVMAEIGHGYGRMAHELLAGRPDLHLIFVDSYRTGDKQPEAYRRTGDKFAMRTAANAGEQIAEAERLSAAHRDRTLFYMMDSEFAAGLVVDGTLDLVFIDADHSYEGCKGDIAAWRPKVKPGGWIGGHDYANKDRRFDFSGVDRAVNEFVAANGLELELDLNFTYFIRL